MNANYRINAGYAILKAQDAVANWEAGVMKAIQEGTSQEIEFCRASLKACKEHLTKVRSDVVTNWMAYT